MRPETGERRRRHRAHEPLQHAEIGLTDAAHLAVAPGLRAYPFDHIVKIVLIVAAEKVEAAAGAPAAAHVHLNEGVAVLGIEIDRPRLAPEKLRTGGENVVVET